MGKPLVLVLLLLLMAGCAPTHVLPNMRDQPYYRPLEESSFFADGQSARTLVPDTVARGQLRSDAALYTGTSGDQLVDTFPFPITREVLKRGQERYNIYCSPCHSRVGDGQGMVVRRGFPPPPSLHIDRLRDAPAGHFFVVITNGLGAMPSYAKQVSPEDRWAIVAYIRALQLSQHATPDDVPPDEQQQLQGADQPQGVQSQ